MKFYKLELINREENYNKVFGNFPNVGVMNPLAKRKTESRIGAIPSSTRGNQNLSRKNSRMV